MPVYIPWPEFGICKFWMVARCSAGKKCKWEHPDAAEKTRMWKLKTAEQDANAAKGIPRPVNPKLARGDKGDREHGLDVAIPDGEGDANVPQYDDGKEVAAAPLPGEGAVGPPMRPPPAQPSPARSQRRRGRVGGSGANAVPVLRREEVKRGVEATRGPTGGSPFAKSATSTSSDLTSTLPKFRRDQRDTTSAFKKMGATKRMSNGEVKEVGPHPSTIQVSARFATQAAIEKRLQPQPAAGAQAAPDAQERSIAEAREDSIRLQGCRWLDDVRRQLHLPIKTFTTACTYYHMFRLAHPQHVAGMEYGNAWADACAASLLTACKVEDTLKKSKDILAAAHNLRAATTGGEQVGTDDPMFEAPSRVVIGLERLVLEAGAFDFRSKYPHDFMMKVAKTLKGDAGDVKQIAGLAFTVLTDMHRTFVPLKQASATMAVASLELASHLHAAGTANNASAVRDDFADFDYDKHATSREEVMETILDALDLYTHHTLQTHLGSKYSLDDYLRIRLLFNKECTEKSIPRYTRATPRDIDHEGPTGNTLHVQNGHPTPVSPQPDNQSQPPSQPTAPPPPEGGTLRFMLNPQLAADEKTEVQKYFVEEWEEYEEEIEVPLPRAPSTDRGSDRSDHGRLPPRPLRDRGPPPPGPPRGEYRGGGGRYDDRRPPPPPPSRYDDRRGGYDDRRYDDRRGGGRYDDRRYDDRRRR